MFSVLMSVYAKERPEYLDTALQSVLEQTSIPDEIVLMEDGILTDGLYAVIKKYKAIFPGLRTYQSKYNLGLGKMLRKGVRLCSYELIARMDTDDIAVPQRFEWQLECMKRKREIAVCGGLIEEFNEEGTVCQMKKMPESNRQIFVYAKERNPVNHMTVMFRKQEVLKAGNYRDIPLLEDYDLWIRMLKNGAQFYNIQQVLVKTRVSDSTYHRRGGRKYCQEYLKLRKRQKNFGLLSYREYIRSCMKTAAITLAPDEVRKSVYIKVLRRDG